MKNYWIYFDGCTISIIVHPVTVTENWLRCNDLNFNQIEWYNHIRVDSIN